MKLTGRHDLIVIAAALLLAALLFLLQARPAHGATVTVYLGSELHCTHPLDEPGLIEVAQEDGSLNRIRIADGQVYMESSTCANQLCVHMDALSASGPDDGWIVCLPNRVTIGLEK